MPPPGAVAVDDHTPPHPPRPGPEPTARAAQDRLRSTVDERRVEGRYEPGLEERLDAHGRTMAAVRSGPGGHRPEFSTTGRRVRWRRRLARARGRLEEWRSGNGSAPGTPLRILFVVQRYGEEVAGGAELSCRQFATRLAARGHRVEVVTSRAQSSQDWADVYPAGTTDLDGVRVHRLGVSGPRDNVAFEAMTVEVLWSGRLVPTAAQEQWRRLQGPDLPELVPWLADRASDYDVVVHFSYLYTPTWAGLPVTSALVPTVLHATAHDEPAFWLPVFDDLFGLPTRYVWFTEEERDLLLRRGAPGRGEVIGIGMDLGAPGDGARFRAQFDLGDRPYLVFVGRVEAGKGSEELITFFEAYKERNEGPLALVLVGPAPDSASPPRHRLHRVRRRPDPQRRTGRCPGAGPAVVLRELLDGPHRGLGPGPTGGGPGTHRRPGGPGSAQRRGALVHRLRRVRGGRRPLGRIAGARRRPGKAGRAHVEREYRWDVVLPRYEKLLGQAIGAGPTPVAG